MKRTWRWFWIGVTTLVLGGLVGGGIALYQGLQRTPGYHLRAGEAALQTGLRAFTEQRDRDAVQAFHEAQLHAENALQKLVETREATPPQSAEEDAPFLRQEGFAYWLKLRAVRGRAWAQVRLDGQTLPAPQANEPPAAYFARLTPNRLPTETSRNEAAVALRQAAVRLPDQLAIQSEAVNFEMQVEPKQWPVAQIVASQLLQHQPQDERALYLMARYEFEQPLLAATDQMPLGMPMPAAKRSRERILKSLDHLKQLAATPEGQRWRTIFLEGQARHWLVTNSRLPTRRKYDEEQRELAALKALLFDEQAGLAARVARIDPKVPMSRLDTEGLFGLHTLAFELLVEEIRHAAKAGDAAAAPVLQQIQQVLQSQAQLTRQVLEHEPTPVQIVAAAELLAASAARAQYLFGRQENATWTDVLGTLEQVGTAALAKSVAEPRLYTMLTELWAREAEQMGQRGRVPRQVELRQAAIAWADGGLRACAERQVAGPAVLALHEAAARVKLLAGAEPELIAPHLAALKAQRAPLVQSAAALIEGVMHERAGRLEKARVAFDRAAQMGAGTDYARRANTFLAPVCLALNQPEAALKALRELERLYGSWNALTEEERSWVFGVVRAPAEVAFMMFEAHLQAAAQAQLRSQTQPASPATTQAAKLVQIHEEDAAKILARFPAKSMLQMAARERLAKHFLLTDRPAQAEQIITSLKQDQFDEVSILRLETQLMLARASADRTALTAIDQHIRQFLTAHPNNAAARLYWAEWLLRTQRVEQAAAYLDDPRNFPQPQELPRWQRVRMVVKLAQAPAPETAALQQAVARDPRGESHLVQAAASIDVNQADAGLPAQRLEGHGLQRLEQAQKAEARGDWAEATRTYAVLVESTLFRPIARQRLQTVLAVRAQQQPDHARQAITQLLQEQPAEPALLYGYAQCCQMLGDLGDPAERGQQIKNMATALQAYEAALSQAGLDATPGAWAKAQMWHQTGRLDVARTEARRVLTMQPRHEGALVLCIQVELHLGDAAALAATAPLLATLQEVQPDSPLSLLLRAQVAEKLGQTTLARQSCEQAVARFPQSSAAYAAWAALLRRQGDVPGALGVVKRWRAALPADVTACQAEIRCLAETGQVTETRAVRDRHLAVLTTQAMVRKERVTEQQQPAQVQALESEKQATLLFLAQGLIQAQAWTEAEAWLQMVRDMNPNLEAVQLAWADLQLARLAANAEPAERATAAREAREALSQVYLQRKGHLVAGANLAWLCVTELNDPEEALRLANEVRQNRFTQRPLPTEMLPVELLDTYGHIYTRLQRAELQSEWRALFESACRRHPHDARMVLHLARAVRAGGDVSQANQLVAQAARMVEQPLSPLTPTQKQRVLAGLAEFRGAASSADATK